MKVKKDREKRGKELPKLNFVRFTKVGDSYSGKITEILKGRFGVILAFGKDVVSISQIVLKRLTTEAFLTHGLDIGSNVKITFEKIVKSQGGRTVKIFSLYVEGVEVEILSMTTIDRDEARKTLEGQLEEKPSEDLPF